MYTGPLPPGHSLSAAFCSTFGPFEDVLDASRWAHKVCWGELCILLALQLGFKTQQLQTSNCQDILPGHGLCATAWDS